MRVGRYCNRLSRWAVDAPTLEVFKISWGFEQPGLVKDVLAYGGKLN